MAEPSNLPEPGAQASHNDVVGAADENEPAVSDGPVWSRGKVGLFLKEKFSHGKEELVKQGTAQYLKGKLALQHSIGLGHRPNVVPPGEASVAGDYRKVEIGWHPVGGLSGKWFAEKTGLGKYITKETKNYPDPSQHWAVLVGDFCHELWMDEHLDVIYINEVVKRDEWHTFEVGRTRFNDEALRQAGEMVIHNMREKRPAYNLISNNCQNFAVYLLEAIKVGAHREFGTAFAVYQRATGKGAIKDLFDEKVDQQLDHDDKPQLHHQDTVLQAQQVMDEQTTKLDAHDQKHFS